MRKLQMNQFCTNCGARLNGEAFCPKCQRPTGVKEDATSPSRNSMSPGPNPKPKWPKWLTKTVLVVYCSLVGLLILSAIVLGVREHIAFNRRRAQLEEIARAERMDAGENLARAKEGDPLHQYVFGEKKSKNATTTHEMDVAAQYLLAAHRGASASGNPKLPKRVYRALVMWQCKVRERRLKPSYWQQVEDAMLEKRNAAEEE